MEYMWGSVDMGRPPLVSALCEQGVGFENTGEHIIELDIPQLPTIENVMRWNATLGVALVAACGRNHLLEVEWLNEVFLPGQSFAQLVDPGLWRYRALDQKL